MPIEQAALKRPKVPGTSIPFFRLGGNGDMLAGKAKYFDDTAEPDIMADVTAPSVTVAIVDGLSVVNVVSLLDQGMVERPVI